MEVITDIKERKDEFLNDYLLHVKNENVLKERIIKELNKIVLNELFNDMPNRMLFYNDASSEPKCHPFRLLSYQGKLRYSRSGGIGDMFGHSLESLSFETLYSVYSAIVSGKGFRIYEITKKYG